MCSTTLDSLHTCVCAGSHRVRVCLGGLINGRNQFHSWGFPQASHSGPSLCRTVETIGFECGLKPLGANNIGNGSKSCSHSARVAVQVCSPERVAIQGCSSERVAVQACSSERVAVQVCSSDRGTVQACFSDRVAATGSKCCLLRRHQRHTRVQRVLAAPNPPRGLASLKLGTS